MQEGQRRVEAFSFVARGEQASDLFRLGTAKCFDQPRRSFRSFTRTRWKIENVLSIILFDSQLAAASLKAKRGLIRPEMFKDQEGLRGCRQLQGRGNADA